MAYNMYSQGAWGIRDPQPTTTPALQPKAEAQDTAMPSSANSEQNQPGSARVPQFKFKIPAAREPAAAIAEQSQISTENNRPINGSLPPTPSAEPSPRKIINLPQRIAGVYPPTVTEAESELSSISRATSPMTDVPASPGIMVEPTVSDDPSIIALNSTNPKMPGLGDIFKSRVAFEQACREVVPADASWKMRVYSSRDESTAKRDTMPAFVELGCTHSGERTCSTLNFRLKALKKADQEWIVVKANVMHDNYGWPPIRPNKRKTRGTMTPEPDFRPLPPRAAANLPRAIEENNARGSPRRAVVVKRQAIPNEYVDIDTVKPKRIPRPRFVPTTYCYCQYSSYDKMTRCADPDCEKQWFHLGCIGYFEEPGPEWKCVECLRYNEPGKRVPVPRLADKAVITRMPRDTKQMAIDMPAEEFPHAPLVAFLNSLNPTLGDATGKILYDSGLTAPMRLVNMTLPQWDEFLKDVLGTKFTPFDYYTLDMTIRLWIAHGRGDINLLK